MELLETLKHKIAGAKDMQSIVKTMKSLAAANMRQYEMAAEATAAYYRTIEMGLEVILRNKPALTVKEVKTKRVENQHLGAVIFGSTQGMCGQFNDKISSFALEQMKAFGVSEENRTVLAMGERVAASLEESGQPVEHHIPISGSLVDITSMMYEVLTITERWRKEGGLIKIILFYNALKSKTSYNPVTLTLYPINPEFLSKFKGREWQSRSLPTFTMDWNKLFSSLIRQYLFILLYRAFVESLASENASRLASMQTAEKNIEEHLEDLNAKFRNLRQASVTAELLDIVSGFEALTT